MSSATSLYRTVFVCTLKQLTAMSVGGRDDISSGADLSVGFDGDNQLVLRGTSLAGDLIATARTLVKDIPPSISSGKTKNGELVRSSWDVWNGHLHPDFNGVAQVIRPGSPHRQDTRAAGKGGLHDYEVVPPGVEWCFLLEVKGAHSNDANASGADTSDAQATDAHIAALTLQEWQRQRAWLGRKVARGLGWLSLVDCIVYELPAEEGVVDAWPDSSLNGHMAHAEKLACIATDNKVVPLTLAQYVANNSKLMDEIKRPSRAYVQWSGSIVVGPYKPANADRKAGISYGYDPLAIAAHGSASIEDDFLVENRLMRAPDQQWDKFENNFSSDTVLATSSVAKRLGSSYAEPLVCYQSQPFIPGTSIGGSLRHWLSRKERMAGEPVWDPVEKSHYGQSPSNKTLNETQGADVSSSKLVPIDAVVKLLGMVDGDTSYPSRLLISDAHLHNAHTPYEEPSWCMAKLEKVALDSFVQNPFGSGKFDRLALFACQFKFNFTLEIDLAEHAALTLESLTATPQQNANVALVQSFLREAALGRIAIGSGEFRGYGHVTFTVAECRFATAGQEWERFNISVEEVKV